MAIKTCCCWCGEGFVRVGEHYWCKSEGCRERQAEHSVYVQDSKGDIKFLYVPLPRQVVYDECTARYLLGGGAAGSTKSHSARWSMYRRALSIRDYEGLLLRETWDELNKHHFRLMDRDAEVFKSYGIKANFSITNREMTFIVDGNKRVIEGGHMEDPKDVRKYLSRERDEIACDEGVMIQPKALLELSTRARSTKPDMRNRGLRGLFRVLTNPGGPSSMMLRDFFIDHSPDWDSYPKKLKEVYDPADWVYIPGMLEDNPYLDEEYESDLAVLEPYRYEQLRHNNWDIVQGLFFSQFKASTHVKDLGDPRDSVEWFRSMDWGYINPGCFHWWACLPDGILYVRRDYKFAETLVDDVAINVLNIDKELGVHSPRYSVADPAVWIKQGNASKGESIEETFARNKVPLIKGDNTRNSGWQRMRELMKLRADGRPTLILHPDCRYTIRTLSALTSSPTDPEDVNTHMDDHGADSLRYGAMSRPSPTLGKSKTSTKTFKGQQAAMKKAKRLLTVR